MAALTPFGEEFCGLLDDIEALQRELRRRARFDCCATTLTGQCPVRCQGGP
jgi:hypothetical protein